MYMVFTGGNFATCFEDQPQQGKVLAFTVK